MHIFSKLVAAMLAWLNAADAPEEAVPASVDWADLPTYHPSSD